MPNYSLIEHKLRRYIYLGNENSMYVPPTLRKSILKPRHDEYITGVRIIGKIVKKNVASEINSIVPIILKIKSENKLLDYRLLVFTLAICARFHLKECKKMVTDAYGAVDSVCFDGLKLLMFVSFCYKTSKILYEEGYLSKKTGGFGNGFRNAMRRWYFNRDPFLTTKQIVKHKRYDGWSHKDVLKLIHIKTEEPSRQIYIIYTTRSFKHAEHFYECKLEKDRIKEDTGQTIDDIDCELIYNFLKEVHDIRKMDDNELVKDIGLKCWGHNVEVIPTHLLCKPKVLESLVVQIPLNRLLDNTFFFSKHRLFSGSTEPELEAFISLFDNNDLLKESQIHPIESFLQYVRYTRSAYNIMKITSNIYKKKTLNVELSNNATKMHFGTENIYNNQYNQNFNTLQTNELYQAGLSNSIKNQTTQSQINEKINFTSFSVKPKKRKRISRSKNSNQIQRYEEKRLMKLFNTPNQNRNNQNQLDNNQPKIEFPTPVLPDLIKQFLAKDLVEKSLMNLKPTQRRILIAYDCRNVMRENICSHFRLLSVHEGITLIILSLIYPEHSGNKPTIIALGDLTKNEYPEVQYEQPLDFYNLEAKLFKTDDNTTKYADEKFNPQISPVHLTEFLKFKKKKYDVFVFLGSNKMDFKYLDKHIKEYQKYLKKPVKCIICCLSGGHFEQKNLSRGNMLFINGIDKHVGKVINSFLNGEF